MLSSDMASADNTIVDLLNLWIDELLDNIGMEGVLRLYLLSYDGIKAISSANA